MKKYIVALIVIVFSVTSCTDLDVVPRNGQLLESSVFTEETAYTAYLAKMYGSYMLTGQNGPAGDADLTIINDEGFSGYIRAYWKAQELTTDEAVIRWTDAGIQDLNVVNWSSENQFVRVLYYRIFYLVALVNDFMRVTEPAVLDANGISEEFRAEIATYRAEARFLRALSYWHALDLFRNVPLITSVSGDLPSQVSPTEMYNFIVGELDEIESQMEDAGSAPYGRADKGALWMLRAKVKLNAPIYLESGDAALSNIYNDVVADLNSVIGAGYSLNPVYLDNFNADNHTSPEMIFGFNADGTVGQTWAGTTFLVRACIFDTMDGAEWGVAGGWSGVRVTKNFVELFETSPDVLDDEDSRQIFFTEERTKDIQDILEITHGYACPKFSNVTSGGAGGSHLEFVDTDYPMFRLGDAYLMYAEAVLRGASNGDQGTALGYINELRERAYGDSDHNITGTDLTLDFVLDERGRELYFEAHRRVDLIRFNKFSSRAGGEEIMWEWKGNDVNGVSVPEQAEYFPIPASDLNTNPNLQQNAGY